MGLLCWIVLFVLCLCKWRNVFFNNDVTSVVQTTLRLLSRRFFASKLRRFGASFVHHVGALENYEPFGNERRWLTVQRERTRCGKNERNRKHSYLVSFFWLKVRKLHTNRRLGEDISSFRVHPLVLLLLHKARVKPNSRYTYTELNQYGFLLGALFIYYEQQKHEFLRRKNRIQHKREAWNSKEEKNDENIQDVFQISIDKRKKKCHSIFSNMRYMMK